MHASAAHPASDSTPFVLATFFDDHPTDGGGYVHKVGTLRVLRRLQNSELQVIVICEDKVGLQLVDQNGLRGVIQRRSAPRRLLGHLSAIPLVKAYLGRSLGPRLSPVDRLLTRLNVDLVLFTSPDARALQLYSCNYIFTIFDLAHLEHPEFPEVSFFGEFERRERMLAQAPVKAIAVLADSESGRKFIAEHYRVPQSRVFAAPFLMSSSLHGFMPDAETSISIRERYNLAEPYIFYPAQFWPHKNHRYILAALRCMRQRYGWAPQAVFCGSDKGVLRSVLDYAQLAGVSDLVNYCGFVPDEHIPYLYQGALALVMPTYFGPNNIPPLEALSLDVPVCYSDLPSFRQHMGDAVTYVDLSDPASLADALHHIRCDSRCAPTRPRIQVGAQLEPADDKYLRVLSDIIESYRYKTATSHMESRTHMGSESHLRRR